MKRNYGNIYAGPQALWLTIFFAAPLAIIVAYSFMKRDLYGGVLPHAQTPWVSPGDRFQADCEHRNGANVLMVRPASASTIRPNSFPWTDWGLHVGEMAMTLGNLITIAQEQTATYLGAHAAGS